MKCIQFMLLLFILCNVIFLHFYRCNTKANSSNFNIVPRVANNNSNNDQMTKVCMMVPVVSRGIKENGATDLVVTDLHLISVFLPSFLNTSESMYRYTIYVGYDYGDKW